MKNLFENYSTDFSSFFNILNSYDSINKEKDMNSFKRYYKSKSGWILTKAPFLYFEDNGVGFQKKKKFFFFKRKVI